MGNESRAIACDLGRSLKAPRKGIGRWWATGSSPSVRRRPSANRGTGHRGCIRADGLREPAHQLDRTFVALLGSTAQSRRNGDDRSEYARQVCHQRAGDGASPAGSDGGNGSASREPNGGISPSRLLRVLPTVTTGKAHTRGSRRRLQGGAVWLQSGWHRGFTSVPIGTGVFCVRSDTRQAFRGA